jgi:hypothetical protein
MESTQTSAAAQKRFIMSNARNMNRGGSLAILSYLIQAQGKDVFLDYDNPSAPVVVNLDLLSDASLTHVYNIVYSRRAALNEPVVDSN